MVLRSDVKLTSHEHLKLEHKQAASILLSDKVVLMDTVNKAVRNMVNKAVRNMVNKAVRNMVNKAVRNMVNKVPMSKFQLNLAKPLLLKVKQLLLHALSKVHNNIQLNGANTLMIPVFQTIFVYVEKKN